MRFAATKGEWLSFVAKPPNALTGVSPAAFHTFLCLLIASPLMRGGNRHVALVLLEAMAIAFIAFTITSGTAGRDRSRMDWVLGLLLFAPAWLALVYLVPLPGEIATAGARALYSEILSATAIPVADWRPLSLVPDATLVSLLSGTLLVAPFLAGYGMNPEQLRKAFLIFLVVACAQVVFGLLQASGGQGSSLYFGGRGGRPFGTFANPNHFANYLAMALVVLILLAFQSLSRRRDWREGPRRSRPAGTLMLWSGAAVFLLVGILMSRSRAGTLVALGSGAAAFILALALGSRSRRKSWRSTALLAAIAVAAGIALVGADLLLGRFDLDRLQGDIPFRSIQAATTLEGAAQFWPWGAGWGSYYSVYPRFQPANLIGIADYAHHDYAQMLFEGGIFAVILIAASAFLLAKRTIQLVRSGMKERKLNRDQMTSAICGIGLLGFLLHSFAEFNMHIPANAIIASLLAGAFLRPLTMLPRELPPEASPHD
jgi:hypothetical protein